MITKANRVVIVNPQNKVRRRLPDFCKVSPENGRICNLQNISGVSNITAIDNE